MKTITIGETQYTINDDQETKDKVFEAIVDWMQHPKHWAAHSGEGIMQDDNCDIDAPVLIGDIVDDILKPVVNS